jgi:hypothetical protein
VLWAPSQFAACLRRIEQHWPAHRIDPLKILRQMALESFDGVGGDRHELARDWHAPPAERLRDLGKGDGIGRREVIDAGAAEAFDPGPKGRGDVVMVYEL